MPLLSAVQLPPPSNWQDFEALCADLWAELYGNADLKGVGRLGQKQKGVDICGEIERGSYVGIQCKCVRADRMLNQDDVLKILDEAKDFCPTLDHLVIATTGLKDSGTEAFCRTLDDKRRSEGLSRITLYSWPDICALLQRYPEVAARHFPFAVRVSNLLVLRNDTNIRPPESKTYSFTKDEFVHPLIIEDLLGWISDPRETVVSVDLTSASGSNRYFGSIEVVRGDTVRVSVHEPDRGWFSYVHLGEAPSGIHVLHAVRDFSPASGRFHYLCFVVFQYDEGLVEKDGILISRGRVLLKTLGSIVLGDRYNGELTYATGILKVGRSSSPWCRDEPGYELRIE